MQRSFSCHNDRVWLPELAKACGHGANKDRKDHALLIRADDLIGIGHRIHDIVHVGNLPYFDGGFQFEEI